LIQGHLSRGTERAKEDELKLILAEEKLMQEFETEDESVETP